MMLLCLPQVAWDIAENMDDPHNRKPKGKAKDTSSNERPVTATASTAALSDPEQQTPEQAAVSGPRRALHAGVAGASISLQSAPQQGFPPHAAVSTAAVPGVEQPEPAVPQAAATRQAVSVLRPGRVRPQTKAAGTPRRSPVSQPEPPAALALAPPAAPSTALTPAMQPQLAALLPAMPVQQADAKPVPVLTCVERVQAALGAAAATSKQAARTNSVLRADRVNRHVSSRTVCMPPRRASSQAESCRPLRWRHLGPRRRRRCSRWWPH